MTLDQNVDEHKFIRSLILHSHSINLKKVTYEITGFRSGKKLQLYK